MVANALRFYVCSCQIAYSLYDAALTVDRHGRIRLWQASFRKEASATHAKTIAGKRPPRTAPRSASNKGSLSRADGRPTPKAAPGDGLRITTNPLAI